MEATLGDGTIDKDNPINVPAKQGEGELLCLQK